MRWMLQYADEWLLTDDAIMVDIHCMHSDSVGLIALWKIKERIIIEREIVGSGRKQVSFDGGKTWVAGVKGEIEKNGFDPVTLD